eukprot:741072-Amphidinium_carterae.1
MEGLSANAMVKLTQVIGIKMYLSHAWIDKIVPITDSEKKLTNVVLAVLGASWLSGPELDDHHCQPLLLGPLRL